MIIVPISWNCEDLEDLSETNDVFDLIMEHCALPYYLIIQDNTITWFGAGKVPGQTALQIHSIHQR